MKDKKDRFSLEKILYAVVALLGIIALTSIATDIFIDWIIPLAENGLDMLPGFIALYGLLEGHYLFFGTAVMFAFCYKIFGLLSYFFMMCCKGIIFLFDKILFPFIAEVKNEIKRRKG